MVCPPKKSGRTREVTVVERWPLWEGRTVFQVLERPFNQMEKFGRRKFMYR